MIKYFCDRCGKECKTECKIISKDVARGGKCNTVLIVFNNGILCEECAKKFEQVKDQLECEEDIFNMTDEDIELLRYTFKIGDEVITDDGRTGTITEICTCEYCKKRGFYEPRVEMKIGSQIYITDADKNNGFISYYKIGDQVFGNIDDEYLWKHRETYQKAIEEIDAQLGVIESIKHN